VAGAARLGERQEDGAPPVTRLSERISRVDVILRCHPGVARMPAFGVGFLRRKRVGRGTIVEIAIRPSVHVRESHAIFFDCHARLQRVLHLHGVRRSGVLFHAPLDIHHFGTSGKKLASGGKALPIRVHHHVIREDQFQLGFGLPNRDNPPVFVSLEIVE
jgi:hypothetical protein